MKTTLEYAELAEEYIEKAHDSEDNTACEFYLKFAQVYASLAVAAAPLNDHIILKRMRTPPKKTE